MPIVLKTCPNVGSPKVWSGTPQVGVLVTLNASNRNSSCLVSVNGNMRNRERSRFVKASALSALRPRFPKVYGAGTANAALLNHSDGVALDTVGLPTRLRRS